MEKETQKVGVWFAAKEIVATIKVPAVPFYIFAVPVLYQGNNGNIPTMNENNVVPADILDYCIKVECENKTDIYFGFPETYAIFVTDNAEGNAPTTHVGEDVPVWWSRR